MLKINIPRLLDEEGFEEVLNSVKNSIKYYGTLKFDFSRTTFISSYGMCLIILLCKSLIKNYKRRLHFVLSGENRKQFLHPCLHISSRLGLFECLPKEISCYPYRPRRQNTRIGSNDSILEVTLIESFEKSYSIIEAAKKALIKDTNYREEQVLDICVMISEMLQNIFYHSRAKNPAMISIQRYPKLEITQLVIADTGVGIPVTIKEAEEYKKTNLTDYEAIEESLKTGVSRYGRANGRGEGLARCYSLGEKLKAVLYIRSNNGYVKYNFRTRIKKHSESNLLAGTQIFVDFPIIKK